MGKPLTLDNTGQVIGVTENFHTESLHETIDPVVLQLHEPDLWSDSGVLIARLNPGDLPAGIDHIRTQLGKYGTDARFDYTFLADEFAAMYRTERRLGSVILSGTLLAIFVACLGLFGLATFMAERRTREIGIRKALGATVTNIVGLLSKDFATLVLFGLVIATPAGYFLMRDWLQNFAYHINLGPGIFLAVAAAVLGVAFLAVSYQSIKAALTDPAESLRYE